jgi:hypothetical protein
VFVCVHPSAPALNLATGERNHLSILLLLAQHAADINAASRDGDTPLTFASRGACARALLQQANLQLSTTPALPLAHAASVTCHTCHMSSAHDVAAVNNVQLVRQLLHLGANHMHDTNKGACQLQQHRRASCRGRVCVTCLFARTGCSALTTAVMFGHTNVVQVPQLMPSFTTVFPSYYYAHSCCSCTHE